jgi:D-arginine utilization repressor
MRARANRSFAHLSHLDTVCEAIAAWLYPYAEVVLHDLRSDRIAGIWNSFSGRRVGTPSRIGKEIRIAEGVAIYGPYERRNRDGRRLKSISNIVYDSNGNRTGLLCLNLDVSVFEAMKGFVESLMTNTEEMPAVLLKCDWHEQLSQAFAHFLQRRRLTPMALTQRDRLDFIDSLDSHKLFATRNATQQVAELLGVSRASVYNWLKQVRGERK